MAGERRRRDEGPGGLLRIVRERGVARASAAFRSRLRNSTGDPALAAWIEAGWAAFLPGERRAWDGHDAESDDLAIDLLFARVLFGIGQEAAAVAAVRAAAERAPEKPEPRFLLCAMLLKRADAEAHAVFQLCFERFSQASPGWDELGAVFLERGKTEAALICVRRGMPGLAGAMRRGQLARELGRLAEATAAFAEAVQVAPRSARAWFLLGTCAQDGRNHAGAARAYGAALALEPGLAEAALNLGTVRQETGDLEGAKAAYRQAVRTRADTFGRAAQALATSPRGELWLDLGRLRRALTE